MSDLPISFPIEAQALDIQHDTDPADDHGRARRIPHLGHALLFFVLVGFCTVVCFAIVFGAMHIHTPEAMLKHPGLALAAQAFAYVGALILSGAIFPLLWQRTFLQGIHWESGIALRRLPWIAGSALLLSVGAQVLLHFVPTPKSAPIDDLMTDARLIWFTAAFGVLLAPLLEEMAFRGFLLPAVATAYDWLTFPRTPAGLDQWQRSTAHTTPALVIAALLSSIPFALMHAAQISYAWGVVGILYGVSLVLSYVRLRTGSLACSFAMHATYNFTIFALLFVSSDGFRHLEKLAQ